jgi:hypothetical protein
VYLISVSLGSGCFPVALCVQSLAGVESSFSSPSFAVWDSPFRTGENRSWSKKTSFSPSLVGVWG